MKITYYAGAADAAGSLGAELDTSDLTANQLTIPHGRANPCDAWCCRSFSPR